MNLKSPGELRQQITNGLLSVAAFGYVSSLNDEAFLNYAVDYCGDALIRRIFFSEIEKRRSISTELVDNAAEHLLRALLAKGARKSTIESMLRRLMGSMSMQMRVRSAFTVLDHGTKQARGYIARRATPAEYPGIEPKILALALAGNEDALVGVIYRWPYVLWRETRMGLFAATAATPWLQRQLIFHCDMEGIDGFLDTGAITDPVTELYVRAKYNRFVRDDLFASALADVSKPIGDYESERRLGLVAWCFAHLSRLDLVNMLPGTAQGPATAPSPDGDEISP